MQYSSFLRQVSLRQVIATWDDGVSVDAGTACRLRCVYASSTEVVYLVAIIATLYRYFFTLLSNTTTGKEKLLAWVSFITFIKKKDTQLICSSRID